MWRGGGRFVGERSVGSRYGNEGGGTMGIGIGMGKIEEGHCGGGSGSGSGRGIVSVERGAKLEQGYRQIRELPPVYMPCGSTRKE